MKVDGALFGELAGVPDRAREVEAAGFDGLFSAEISNDPFFPLLLAAEHTERVELMTAIAVAFARNPMTLAQVGHDLNAYSKGRLTLGLGSQIRPHITRRFSMPWSRPAARMREFVLAMRAIWRCWYTFFNDTATTEIYTHTLMTPMFRPAEKRFGAPRVMLAGVGALMTEVAGEVADGLIAHAFTTERYLREVTLPALERGLAKAGRDRGDFEITCPVFVVTGADDQARAASREIHRKQIAFYGSTPAYRPVLELHGWEALHEELHRLSKRGRWDEMGTRIDDEVLATFAIEAPPGDVAAALRSRYGDILDRVTCTVQLPSTEQQAALITSLRG
jgi:probable F420-dependent oxidoreductase